MRSQTAKLTVYVPPEPPEITQGPVVTTTAGAGVQLTCISKGGKPAAEVSLEAGVVDGVVGVGGVGSVGGVGGVGWYYVSGQKEQRGAQSV